MKPHNTRIQMKILDRMMEQADIIVGKNSDKFDLMLLNTYRLVHGLPPQHKLPTDDLEKQFRRHFKLLSQTLDYYSEVLGLGGKNPMIWQDWVDLHCYYEFNNLRIFICPSDYSNATEYLFGRPVSTIIRRGKEALRKMVEYGCKDVADTRAIWMHAEKYLEPRYNRALTSGLCCVYPGCGSKNIVKAGIRKTKTGVWQRFYCKAHQGPAGLAPIRANGLLGQIR